MAFTDKVVLITGASSGIGAATAIYLSKMSAKLVLVGRKPNNLQRIASYCEKAKGIEPLVIIADITMNNAVDNVVQQTIEHFGQLNVLVNSAGIIGMGGIKNSTIETYDRVMSINMRSVYLMTKLAVPHLKLTKGCVVNVSCVGSKKPSTMALAYNISKAALDHFTKCVALELAPDGIRVNSVNPGFVKTNLLKDIGLNQDQLDMYERNVVQNVPLKKPVEANEIAALIAHIASDAAASITGSNFVIDGGVSLS